MMKIKNKNIGEILEEYLKTILMLIYIRYLYYFRYKKILLKNKELKNKYQGKRIFLIGNGSSLSQMDLAKLKNEYTFALHYFYLHKDFRIIRPKFYSIMEPVENMKKNNFGVDKFLDEADESFRDIDTKIFFRIDIKDYIEKRKLFLNKDIYYLLLDRGILETPIINDDISRYHSFGDASIYNAICLAVYMGFSEIYLIGCDYDVILHKDVKHFYDDKAVGVTSVLKNESNLNLAKDLVIYLGCFEKIKNHFSKKYNVKIFNAGIGGLTDTFPRVDYESLFEK